MNGDSWSNQYYQIGNGGVTTTNHRDDDFILDDDNIDYDHLVDDDDDTFEDPYGNGNGYGYGNHDGFNNHDDLVDDVSHDLFGLDDDEVESESQYSNTFDNKGETTIPKAPSNSEKNKSSSNETNDLIYNSPGNSIDIGDDNFDTYTEILESRFEDVAEPFQYGKDLPFLFYVPRTGANLQEQLLLRCHGLVAASGRDALGGEHVDEPVKFSSY